MNDTDLVEVPLGDAPPSPDVSEELVSKPPVPENRPPLRVPAWLPPLSLSALLAATAASSTEWGPTFVRDAPASAAPAWHALLALLGVVSLVTAASLSLSSRALLARRKRDKLTGVDEPAAVAPESKWRVHGRRVGGAAAAFAGALLLAAGGVPASSPLHAAFLAGAAGALWAGAAAHAAAVATGHAGSWGRRSGAAVMMLLCAAMLFAIMLAVVMFFFRGRGYVLVDVYVFAGAMGAFFGCVAWGQRREGVFVVAEFGMKDIVVVEEEEE